ncbi:TonB-dependent receptor [Haliea sp.]|uniref:TonB-dependent receptor n=1 Tax=Haliea sp. TaxID=1932666 RepID=UPI00352898D4
MIGNVTESTGWRGLAGSAVRAGALPALLVGLSPAAAGQTLETVTVEGRRVSLVGEAITASEGVIGRREIALRPLLRTGEVLELVPGMVVTQHSGTGKANQYFLRGFNLDHGTDFATFIDGMPLNLRSHGHGQGYTDLNPVIPEALATIAYKKGPYYADVGDFSGAGSAEMRTVDRVDDGLAEITWGEDGYQRLVLVDSQRAAGGDWLYALEGNRYDGPWRGVEEDLSRVNLLLKHSRELAGGSLSLTAMAYDNSWNSADQIPARAVTQGIIDDLGVIDDTVGGESSRYSLSAAWRSDVWQAEAWLVRYDLNLWSNFTYFLDDPERGDQFEQVDERLLYGGRLRYNLVTTLAGLPMTQTFGVELRVDDIDEVGLYRSVARQRTGPVRSDAVEESSIGLFWEQKLQWTPRLRSVVGLRYDHFDFDVSSAIDRNINGVDLSANGGRATDDLWSLKGSLIYSLSDDWETYVSAGQGFHSNDARGTTVRIDPADGAVIDAVDPLVRSLGYEAGVRGFWRERLNTSLAVWYLELDSELLFVGDAGNTEASGRSERNGVEITAYYALSEAWTLDLEYAWTDARFADAPRGERAIPGAVEHVAQAGISLDDGEDWFGSLRLRYFGERPLVEDASATSDATFSVNLGLGRHLGDWTLRADVLNLLDSDDHDIDYFYASRLPGEAEGGVEDQHYHVLEPRTVRLTAAYRF